MSAVFMRIGNGVGPAIAASLERIKTRRDIAKDAVTFGSAQSRFADRPQRRA